MPHAAPLPGSLADYDILLINSSAGKDSMTTLRVVTEMAREQGVEDRIVVVHADLERADWEGTRDLAEKQVAYYGHRFEVTNRPQGDLLDHVVDRDATLREKDDTTPGWPTPGARYCTSDHKRGPIYRVMTKLVKELELNGSRPARILNIMGLRAEESAKRAKMQPFFFDEKASRTKADELDDILAGRKKRTRLVWTWLPIHHWTEREVWADIHAHEVPYHWAYDIGMPRLSCCFCFLANRSALILAAYVNEPLANKWLDIENSVVGTFQKNLSMAEIIEIAQSQEEAPQVMAWCD